MSAESHSGLTVKVDRGKCRSYENCVAAAPNYFEMDGLGIAVVKPEPESGYDPNVLRKAARLCPVRAIQVIESQDQHTNEEHAK